MCEQFQGLGITRDQLRPGTVVMVAVGRGVAALNDNPTVVTTATVEQRASSADKQVYRDQDAEMWWLTVHMAPGVDLPQMYRADEILGVPSLAVRGLAASP